MNKSEKFNAIANSYKSEFGEPAPYAWLETPPDMSVTVEGHFISVIENTNFLKRSAEMYAGPDMWHQWIIVAYRGELYRMKSIYDSWDGTSFEPWQRIEKQIVSKIEYVEADKED